MNEIEYDDQLRLADIPGLLKILRECGNFNDDEINVAEELMRDIEKPVSEQYYRFVVARDLDRPVGYLCYARIEGTDGRYELYWLAVSPSERKKHIGTNLLKHVEETIIKENGKKIILVTSSKDSYLPARCLYYSMGYYCGAELKDYYEEGDDEVFFVKRIFSNKVNIAVVHQHIDPSVGITEKDTLIESDEITKALNQSGFSVCELDVTLDSMFSVIRKLEAMKPVIVFNMVESLDGSNKNSSLWLDALDYAHLPYTGTHAEAYRLTEMKPEVDNRLSSLVFPHFACQKFVLDDSKFDKNTTYILKPVDGAASEGLEMNSVNKYDSQAQLEQKIKLLEEKYHSSYFAEEFIDGDEYTVSLMPENHKLKVINIARMDYGKYWDTKPKMLTSEAKWNPESEAYKTTNRSFTISEEIKKNISSVADYISNEVLHLDGYVRMDVRYKNDTVYVIDINANPCLSDGSGFRAALENAGIKFTDALKAILSSAS